MCPFVVTVIAISVRFVDYKLIFKHLQYLTHNAKVQLKFKVIPYVMILIQVMKQAQLHTHIQTLVL